MSYRCVVHTALLGFVLAGSGAGQARAQGLTGVQADWRPLSAWDVRSSQPELMRLVVLGRAQRAKRLAAAVLDVRRNTAGHHARLLGLAHLYQASWRSAGRAETQAKRAHWLRKALSLYGRLARRPAFRSFSGRDEALFSLGDLASAAAAQAMSPGLGPGPGRAQRAQRKRLQRRARRAFAELRRRHPKSRFVWDAWLLEADESHGAGKHKVALRQYARAARSPLPHLANYARYRQSYCRLDLKQTTVAMTSLERQIRTLKAGALRRAVARGLVRAYKAAGRKPAKAHTYFATVAGKRRGLMLRLQLTYLDQRFAQTQKKPKTPRATWTRLAAAYKRLSKGKLGKAEKLPRELRAWAALGVLRCWMQIRNVASRKTVPFRGKSKARNVCIRRAGGRCLRWRYVWPKLKIPTEDQHLLTALVAYLKLVPRSKWRPTIVFNIGHLYWKYNHFNKATTHFMEVVNRHTNAMPKAARSAAFRVIGMHSARRRWRAMRRVVDRCLASKKLMEDEIFAGKIRDFQLKAMWTDADNLRKKKKYAACGRVFEKMAVRFRSGSLTDTLLWNAGACYEAAGRVDEAIAMRLDLVRRYPKSKHRALAMYYVAESYRNVARFARAAHWYEAFSSRFPKRKQAPESRMWAIVLWSSLGKGRRMLKNVAGFLQYYQGRGGKYPKLCARAFWQSVLFYKRRPHGARYVQQLSKYLRRHGRTGDVDTRLEALVALGNYYWRRSCPGHITRGLCAVVRTVRVGRKTAQRITGYRPRNRAVVARTRLFFTRALRQWAGGRALLQITRHDPSRQQRLHNARKQAARATFMLAELALENHLRQPLPTGLSFRGRSPGARLTSLRRLQAWWTQYQAKGLRLATAYGRVITPPWRNLGRRAVGSPHWSVAAMARKALLYRSAAQRLQASPLPKTLPRSAAGRRIRAHLRQLTRGALRHSKQAYAACVALSKKLRWHNAWSTQCRLALRALSSSAPPLGRERHASPQPLPPRLHRASFH